MRILRPNETGVRGYLLEYDAGVIAPSLNQKFIKEIKEQITTKKFNLKQPYLYAVMQKYGVENKNGRIYPEEILRREADNYMKLIEMGASAGESDHADSAVIAIQNTSMRVTKLWWEGRSLMGEIYLPITRGYIEMGVCSHPADKVAHDIIHGFQYGVSSRGVGSLESVNGQNIVQEDFEIICWDFVTTPSTHGSWVYPEKDSTKPHVESAVPSEFERQMLNGDQEDEDYPMFDRLLGKRKQKNVDSVFNRFMKGYR